MMMRVGKVLLVGFDDLGEILGVRLIVDILVWCSSNFCYCNLLLYIQEGPRDP